MKFHLANTKAEYGKVPQVYGEECTTAFSSISSFVAFSFGTKDSGDKGDILGPNFFNIYVFNS